ncbi:hypothetical protein [Lewinella sp. 4G2]|uniref:hypothetical protein n=1 Tax=Lewinella sp. 4G2 TaxID=1803372 RepID=UPI0012F8E5A9|nr:hypothetical protein [Lewinella sp. 4G2]
MLQIMVNHIYGANGSNVSPSNNAILELVFSDITFAVLAATKNLSDQLNQIISKLVQQFEEVSDFLTNLRTDYFSKEQTWVDFLDEHKEAIELLRFDLDL